MKELTELDLAEAEDAPVCTVHHRLDDLSYCSWAHLSLWKTQRERPVAVNLQFCHIQELLSHRNTKNDKFKILNQTIIWHRLHHTILMVSVFFIIYDCACLCVLVCAATRGSFLQSVSAWVLWGNASAAEAPSHTSHCKQDLLQQNSLQLLLVTSGAVPVAQSSSLASVLQ